MFTIVAEDLLLAANTQIISIVLTRIIISMQDARHTAPLLFFFMNSLMTMNIESRM